MFWICFRFGYICIYHSVFHSFIFSAKFVGNVTGILKMMCVRAGTSIYQLSVS